MPRRLRRWFDPFAALLAFRAFVAARAAAPFGARRTAWLGGRCSDADERKKRLGHARPELEPMDWRNPPSETIGSAVLPLAATAATAAAALYFAAVARTEESARSESVAAAAGKIPAAFDVTPAGVAPVTVDAPAPAGAVAPVPAAPAAPPTGDAGTETEANTSSRSTADEAFNAGVKSGAGDGAGSGGGGGGSPGPKESTPSQTGGSIAPIGPGSDPVTGNAFSPTPTNALLARSTAGQGNSLQDPSSGIGGSKGKLNSLPRPGVGGRSTEGLSELGGGGGLGSGGAAMSLPSNSDVQVNTYTTNDQYNPSVAADADGDFVVTWMSYRQDGDGIGIYAQRYGSDGTARGAEFRVNTYTTSYQWWQSVAMDADGDFVVAWESAGQDGSSGGIYAQRYGSDGTPSGTEFRVNTYTTNDQYNPSVAMDADGDFVVAWAGFGQNGAGVFAQRYGSDGTARGPEFRVNTFTTNPQYEPSVAMDAEGNFVIAWGSIQDGSSPFYDFGIYARRYNSDGTVRGPEFRVNAYTISNQQAPSVAMDADGDFVVAWLSELQGGSSGVYAQRYGSDGTARGPEFRVNTSTISYQDVPSVAMDADGDFAVAWVGWDGSDTGIYAQRYGSDGTALGPEFRVNNYTAIFQRTPSMAMDAGGNFVVAWTSYGQEPFNYGVFMSGATLVRPPQITGLSDDTGASNSDRLTYDTTPTISGTSDPSAVISVYDRRSNEAVPTLLGTATADGSGLWTYTLSAVAPDDTYVLTATAALAGSTSPPSAPFTYTLDTTPPELALTLPCGSMTYDRRPEITATAADPNGFASTTTVTLDADLNNDGDFTDPGETGFATAALVNGAVLFNAYPLLTVGDTTRFRARVTDRAGNEGTSPAATVTVVASTLDAGDLTPQVRSGYGGMASWGADGLQYAGDVTAVHTLDLDRSPAPARGVDPYLGYHSQEAAPAPVVQALVQSDNSLGLPDAVTGTLTWDGAVAGTPSYTLAGLSPGGQWVFAAQPTTGLTTGRHTYTLDLFLDYAGTDDDTTVSVTGFTFVVNRTDSPYGAGWAFSETDALVTVAASGGDPAGVLRAFGGGGWAFYADDGAGGYTEPPGDAGTLATSGGGWTYSGWDGQVLAFDSSGRMTTWASPSGADVTTYTYDGANAGTAARVATVASSDGGVATFSYSGGRLSTVTAPGARTTALAYSSSALSTVTDAAGGAHTFAYSALRLTGETYGVTRRAYTYSNGLVRTVQLGTDPVGTVTAAQSVGLAAAGQANGCGDVSGSFQDGAGAVTTTWFNTFGQVVRTRAADGGVTSIGRDANGWVVSTTDPLGRRYDYVVNARGQVEVEVRPDSTHASWEYEDASKKYALKSHTDFRGQEWVYTNDAYGRRTSESNPLHATWTYEWGATPGASDYGRLKKVTNPAPLSAVTYLYDAFRRPEGALSDGKVTGTTGYDAYGFANRFADPRGNVNTVTNDKLGRPVGTENAIFNRTTTAYEAGGQVRSTSDERGNVTSFAYDAAGRTRAVVEARNTALQRRTTYSYDAAGRPESTLDPLNRVSAVAYDAVGRVTATVDPLGNRTATMYDLAGQQTATQDARGRVTRFRYDALGRVNEVVDALGGVTTTLYDENSNVVATVDPEGNRTTYHYDAADRLAVTVDPELGRTTVGYDAANQVRTVTDPRSGVTSYGYDARGNRTSVQASPDGFTTLSTGYAHDAADNLTTITDARGQVSVTDYDPLNRPRSWVDPEGNRTSVAYDAAGNVAAEVDAFGRRTTFLYDALNRREAVIDPLNKRSTVVYDAGDRAAVAIDPRGNRTTSAYDALDRLTSVRDARSNTTAWRYDAVGNPVAAVDALGRETRTAYDGLNRPVATTDPLGNTTTTVYDKAGRVLSTTDPLGNVTSYAYDGAGRRTRMIEAFDTPLERTTTYGYDANGNLTARTDPRGEVWTTVYDRLDRVTETINPLMQTVTTVYDANGNVSLTIDARGNRTSFVYDDANRLVEKHDAAGAIWTTVYDRTRVLSTIDGLGNVTSYGYDDAGRVTLTLAAYGTPLVQRTTSTYDDAGNLRTVTDPFNRTTTYGYDANNRRTTTQDPAGNVWTTQYDALGRAWRTVDPLGRDRRTYFDAAGRVTGTADALGYRKETVYDAAGNVLATVDELGNRTTMEYDALNRAEVTIDAANQRTTTHYDAASNVLWAEDPRNGVTSYQYDEAGRMVVKGEGLRTLFGTVISRETIFNYDPAGNLTGTLDALGRYTGYDYDGLNRRTVTEDAEGNLWTVTYDKAGNLKTRTDPEGVNRTTVFNYDALNRRVEAIDPLGNVTTTAYDGTNGRKEATVDPRGNRTTSVYDAADRVSEVINPLNQRTTHLYDTAGQLRETVDALGERTTYLYDARGLREAVIDPLNHRTTTVYDKAGRVLATVDGLGNRTTNHYDKLGRVEAVEDARTFRTTSVFDAVGNRTVLVDAAGNRTTWVYDALSQVRSEQDVGGTATFAYDAAGQLKSTTDKLGRRRDFDYDQTGHKTSEVWFTAGVTVQLQTWTYDDAGRMATAQDPDGAYTYGYDRADRVTQVDGPFGVVFTYGYDKAGNRDRVLDSKAGVTTIAFDALNRQSSERVGGAGVTPMRFDYGYTVRGQRESVTRFSDLAGTVTVVHSAYGYDDAGRHTSLTHKSAAGATLAHYTYAYDNADRLSGKTEDGTPTGYDYNAASQLTQDGSATFGYDAAGNRTNPGYATGAGNRITTDGVWTYTHDAEGNVTKRSKGAASDTWVYTYDHRNQLLTAAFSATDGGAAAQLVTYSYDASGARIQRVAWDGTTTTTERYALDGGDAAKPQALGNENKDPALVLDGTNAVTTRWAFGAGQAEVVARQTAAGAVTWDLTDRQGSVRLVVDNSATVLGTAAFDAYGNLTAGTLYDGFGYTGQKRDSVTLLYSNGNGTREYSPDSGVWLQSDPAWPTTGEANPFMYVRNSPTNGVDPSGMWLLTTEDQLWIWEAIRDEAKIDITFQSFGDKKRINAGRDDNTHGKLYGLLPKFGLSEAETRQAINALYGGDLSPRIGEQNRSGNLDIRLTPPQTLGVLPIQTIWKAGGANKLGFTKTSEDGVWVLPGRKLAQADRPLSLYLIRPTDKSESVYLVTSWNAQIWKSSAQTFDKGEQPEKPILSGLDGKFTPTLGPHRHDKIREEYGNDMILSGVELALDISTGKAIIKGGITLGKATISILVKSGERDVATRGAAAAVKYLAETSGARVNGPGTYIFKDSEIEGLKGAIQKQTNNRISVERLTPDMLRAKPDLHGGFLPPKSAGEQGFIYLHAKNPTYFEFVHELFHWRHYEMVLRSPAVQGDVKLAYTQFVNTLSTIQKEEYVFRQLAKPHIWGNLDVAERRHAIDYFRSAIIAPKDGRFATKSQLPDLKRLVDEAESRLYAPFPYSP